MASQPRTHNDYTVGWVCALPKEQTAAIAMLDQRHADLPRLSNDHNVYTLGSIGNHNIAVACLPMGKIGATSTAMVATQMTSTFPSIKFGLMVGIGGGVSLKVRLGDIVVGTPSGQYPGVVQWDMGKEQEAGFIRTGALNNPPHILLDAISKLEAERRLRGYKIPAYMDEMVSKYPDLESKYLKSESLEDVVKREARAMLVHYGLIASGNSVIKSAAVRKKLQKRLGRDVLCVETEAAGLVDNFPCIVIRGICDYADSHKNDAWQEHAAALAAAYAKELLRCIVPSDVDSEQTVKNILGGISSALSSLREDVTQTRSRLDKIEDLEILDWLSATDYGPQQTDYFRMRQPGTGQWLLDCKEYQSWITGIGNTLFYDLEKRFYSEATTAIVYVYCNYKRQTEQTLKGLLSSLLKQLAQSQYSLPDSLKTLHDRHKVKQTRPSLEELSGLLELITAQNSNVFIVADALDECQTTDGCRAKFLSALFSLQKKTGVNFLATSRDIPDITDRFRGTTLIEILAAKEDVERYLHGHLSELPRFVTNRPDIQDEIITKITNAASGMFLLARLHFVSLVGKDTPKAMRKALQGLVTGADAYNIYYEHAMERVEGQLEEQTKRAKQVLSWVTCAMRPLTILELQHAVALEPDELGHDEDNMPQVEDMISVCAGLVAVDEESRIVRLVHYTTQEYFARTQSKWFPDAQLSITITCITYLSYQDFANGECETTHEFRKRLRLYPFYNYAACNWGHHGRKVSACRNIVSFLRKPAQVQASTQVLFEYKNFYGRMTGRKMTSLHLAAYFGLDEATTSILGDHNADATDVDHRTPLSYAAENGNETIVRLLLDTKEIDPDLQGFNGRTPLSYAAENGNETIVRLLLDTKEIDPNLSDERNQTPLAYAAENGDEAIVRLLLDTKEINPNLTDRHLIGIDLWSPDDISHQLGSPIVPLLAFSPT
ncbi:hypothetical protein GQX73_g6090 [Xylaria multiplex]|uniref:Uncharacterized protein n=1 Tax=Xylaria multiplex TaxID=323545 RepID=A0A7C8IN94_9PEZI|nr:hypothetical protein GQX73_g6090 [Xylaria multiplex]